MTALYDDIVIGAGSAGAVLAARLSEDSDRAVLLLDGGPDYPSVEQTPAHVLSVFRGNVNSLAGHDWEYTAEAVPGREIGYPRGKLTGGSSAINGAIALRGVPADYDEWAALDNPAWRWAEVLEVFRRLEDDHEFGASDVHGGAGPIHIRRTPLDDVHPIWRAFVDACRSLGFPEVADHNDPASSGVGPVPTNQRGGTRISTALAYLLPARDRLNLTVRGHCLVDRVLIEDGRAVGVEVISGERRQRVYGRRVILAAGAIGSPAILLRSGIGPAAELTALGVEPLLDRPGVGANLIDHPWCQLYFTTTGEFDLGDAYIQQFARYTAPGSAEFNDMQLYMMAPFNPADFLDPTEAGQAAAVAQLSATLQRPRTRGRVSLTSPDPHVQPRIELNYASDHEDLRRLAEGLRTVWQLAQTDPLAGYIGRALPVNGIVPTDALFASDDELHAFVRGTVTTIFHPVGTARMGPSGDDGAVVDQFGRVHGVDDLYVADASIMPAIPRANTNLTCIVIGERVAEWLRAE